MKKPVKSSTGNKSRNKTMPLRPPRTAATRNKRPAPHAEVSVTLSTQGEAPAPQRSEGEAQDQTRMIVGMWLDTRDPVLGEILHPRQAQLVVDSKADKRWWEE